MLIGLQKRHFRPIFTVMGKIWLAYRRHYASIQPLIPFHCFVPTGPPNYWPAGYPRSAPLWGLTGEDSRFQANMSRLKKSQFLGDL